MDIYANEKFCGDITCKDDEEMLKFETVALQCGYSVAIRPMKDGKYHLVIFREENII